MSELPATREVRRRIENLREEVYRNALKFAWLGLCRASEVVGVAYESDKGTTARGPTGNDFETTEYRGNGEKIPVVIFNVKTSKRDGLARSVAYPIDRGYEPWAVDVYEYFEQFKEQITPIFMFTRQKLWSVAKATFTGLTYPIEEYQRVIGEGELKEGMRIIEEDEESFIVKVEKHRRVMGSHALRHIRAVDLMSIHGFTIQELSTIGGWTLRGMTGASGSIERYAHLGWHSYFPKLLIKRSS